MRELRRNNDVFINEHTENSFEVCTGDFIISYAPFEHPLWEGWITVRRKGTTDYAIGTKLANGQHLNVTDRGSGTVYRWELPRKDRDMFRDLEVAQTADAVEIVIRSSRRWADFESKIVCYMNYPGLIHWTVAAHVKTDKIFDNPPEPDCHFMNVVKAPAATSAGTNAGARGDGKRAAASAGKRAATAAGGSAGAGGSTAEDGGPTAAFEPSAHRAVRHVVQRGPASGIAYFRDLDMQSDVFYFEDFTSLNELYRISGCANPFTSYSTAGQPGAVKMGTSEGEFQSAQDGDTFSVPWTPYEEKTEMYSKFGYERPQNMRIPGGVNVTLADTYLYLKPSGRTDSVSVCRDFVELLARVYQYIEKPSMIATDWAGEVVPRMSREIMLAENSSQLDGEYFFPRAYIRTGPDRQLWNVAQLLLPLTKYVAKYPEQKDPRELKARLEKSLPLFFDSDYKGFYNNLPPVDTGSFAHTIYIFNPAINLADLALMGNGDARRMILGMRERFLDMGRTCDYVFADVLLGDYAKQKFLYQFDNTCAYVYVMLALHELSDRSDGECLDGAKAAAEQLTKRRLDLMWEINLTATGAVACHWLYEVTGDDRYRDIAFIPLANTLRWAWLWDCGYGIGEHVTTFWGFCGTPACPQTCEYESHQTRRMLKAYLERAGSHLSDEARSLLADGWRRGPTQSRFALAPFAIEAGAESYLVAEGPLETDCGEIVYEYMIPFEDFRPTWGTDLVWSDNNAKIGHVGQEIYGAGGPIWYALWQDELRGGEQSKAH